MNADEQFLRRAIRLAMNGRGTVEPNPMVGCVIVKDGRVIGEGWHARYGGPHAEPTALAACTESPAGATAYVTLEPCCHTDKQTPPCAPRLIREGIARVVVGCLDPNPKVNGNGVRMLREAGVTVDGPVLEAECKQLIAPFLALWNSGFYTTLKWAESGDGKVAGPRGRRLQISNARSTRAVQELRSRCDAIAVGINTVLNDDPTLLPRDVPILRSCRRMVLDSRLRMPLDAQLVRTADRGPVEVWTTVQSASGRPAHVSALRARGVIVEDDNDDTADGRLSRAEWFNRLRGQLTHLMVEPGPTLAQAMLDADRAWIIRSPTVVGDPSAPAAVVLPDHFRPVGTLDLDEDTLTEYLNVSSATFFAPVPSADLVLAEAPI